MERITLYNGIELPMLGFGTFQITDHNECRRSVLSALKHGYRLIDTAACYGNEKAVGEAVKESGLERSEVSLVSKVWIQDSGRDAEGGIIGKRLRIEILGSPDESDVIIGELGVDLYRTGHPFHGIIIS